MDSQSSMLQMFFFPQMLGGHLIPMIDLARAFASHGVKATIITTPHNALLFQKTIQRDQQLGHSISFHTVKLPAEEFGLPDGCENQLAITSVDMSAKLFMAMMKLQDPLEQLVQEMQPDCIVSDMFHPWTADAANRLGIPRIVFHGTGCFSLCAEESIRQYAPHEKVVSDTEAFELPGLPDKIELTKSKLPDWAKTRTGFGLFLNVVLDSELKSYGVVVNSFCELEPTYAEYYRNQMGRKVWHIGPVSLCNRRDIDKLERGIQASTGEQNYLTWLNSKEPNSVLYISFGSLPRIAPEQLLEIAHGLEDSNHSFFWVVGRSLESESQPDNGKEAWLPVGFGERMMGSNRGMIIHGWAPQLLILEHEAVGGFMTHCGWNSTLEGVTAGVPMITWPITSEQFYNEKFVVDVLKIGISVGNEEWVSWHAEPKVTVAREKVATSVSRLMDREEDGVAEMRKRAKELGEKAKTAVEDGGSSFVNVRRFIEELKSCRKGESSETAREQ